MVLTAFLTGPPPPHTHTQPMSVLIEILDITITLDTETRKKENILLLPTGIEEREVLGVGSIPVAIFISRQFINNIARYLHRYKYSWVVKIRNT